MARLFTSVAIISLLLAACGGDGTGPDAGNSIRVVTAPVTDTIGSPVVQPLTVAIRISGKPAQAGTAVHFEASGSLELAPPDSTHFRLQVDQLTSAAGEATVRVAYGQMAGTAYVRISVASAGLTDSAAVVMTPGSPAAVTADPADTAIFVGATVQGRATLADRVGDPVPGAITWQSGSPAVTVTPNGAFHAAAIGRASLIARFGSVADTTWVSVVPAGVLSAYHPGQVAAFSSLVAGNPQSLVTFNTDGAAGRAIFSLQSPEASDWFPYWEADGQSVVFFTGYGTQSIYRVLASGPPARTLLTPPGNGVMFPQPSRDGQWVYYVAFRSSQFGIGSGPTDIWRVAASGGTGTQVMRNGNAYGTDGYPSPSFDNTRLAFQIGLPGNPNRPVLGVLNLATGTTQTFDIEVYTPRWSPVGEQIAFQDGSGSLYVVNSDGTGLRKFSPTPNTWVGGLDWSPDGQWIVANDGTRLVLLSVDGQTQLPLAYTAGLRFPSWRAP
jgi:Tol biopolymer transport system component